MDARLSLLRWITLAAFLFWLGVYWRGGQKIVADIRSSAQAARSRLDTFLMAAMTLLTLVILASAILISLGWIAVSPPGRSLGLTLAGAALTLAGIAGMFYCRSYLGRFWTAETTLMEGHQVVASGPYGLVRHPIYTFAGLMYAGLALAFPTWWVALVAGLIVVAYALKAQDEERFLRQELPGYGEYQRRVKRRLIPGVW